MAALGTGGLIWLILRTISPAQAVFGTVLFACNPLVIIESALGGHNDMCMMLLAVLAVWLHLRGFKSGTVVALVLSALVKVITAPLAPLYLLMILRRNPGVKEGARFLVTAGLGSMAAVLLSASAARMNPNGLMVHTAASAQFYENNYHELVFKALRRVLGESADSMDSPMDFQTWWVETWGKVVLHEGTSNKTRDLAHLKSQQPLLVISDEDSDDWLRVYDPVDHLQGYVDWPELSVIPEPPGAERDPNVQRLSGWPPDWPTVIQANRLIRVATWSLFIIFGLLAAWKTTDFDAFLIWSNAFFLAALLLVFTKVWCWYVIWPLAFGALKPGSFGARLAIFLSAGMITMYALFDYSSSLDWRWVNDYRSIPAIVLPVLLCAALEYRRLTTGRSHGPHLQSEGSEAGEAGLGSRLA